jgi:hypothetical protein
LSKIFKYEIKIILLKPYVLAMMIINLLYAYYILSAEIILGISDTAPFSAWSFGKYLGDATLISTLVTLFVLSTLYSGRQKKVSILTDVTGFPVNKRMLIRNVIIGGFFLLNNLLIFITGCVFLKVLFGKIYPGLYIANWLLITIPCMVIILGAGNLLGRISPALIYVFMGVVVLMAFVMRQYSIDINGANYYEVMSESLESLKGAETPFTIAPIYLFTRLVYLILGAFACVCVTRKTGEKKNRDI